MQFVAVDIGNSSTKIAVEGTDTADRWSAITIIRDADPIAIELSSMPAFWAICSVNRRRQIKLTEWIATHRPDDVWHLIDDSEVNLESRVESRSQVGRDRLVAAWMAIQLNDGIGPVAVIDAGTAVTVDLVDANNRFQGGAIFPGASCALKFLSDATDVLPDLSKREFLDLRGDLNRNVIGNSTQTAIVRGVYQCQIGGIKHIVAAFQAQTSQEIQVYATGGGIADLQEGLPSTWNFVPDLVLRGAQHIGRNLIHKTHDS